MRYTAIITLGILALLLISGLSLNVEAGVEPSPFNVGKVKAISNDLEAINYRLEILLNPESCKGDGSLNGPMARLDTISGQLVMLQGRVQNIFDEILYSEDLTEAERDAVYQARVLTTEIRDTVNSYLIDPETREPIVPDELVPALIKVRTDALDLGSTLRYYVRFPGDGGTGL